jgi:hypothetical protein
MMVASEQGVFDSAWLKWAGGMIEARVLGDSVSTFVAAYGTGHTMPMILRSEYDPKRRCVVVTVAACESPFPPLWGIFLGNIVHTFRSALDHVAWALYKQGRTPNLGASKERQVYFPIAATRADFNASLDRKLPGVGRKERAIVRRCQPFRAGKRVSEHVLWVLDELSREDKHRAIRFVNAVPDSVGIEVVAQSDCVYRRMAKNTPRAVLEPGVELARVYVRKTGPDPMVEVRPEFRIDASVTARLTLESFLRQTPTVVSRVLYAFAEPPSSVKAIVGGDPPRA